MIEGGVPGGSAAQQAEQRRATANRLILEANWLDTIAADQSAMSAVLAGLPQAYSVMHDLKVPGSKGTIDHMVVGPGGAFIVITRRYSERVDYRDGQLWAGERSLRSVLDGVREESQLLTQSLATPVVPVLALLDSILPAATPAAVDGVLVTSNDNVVRVITRGAHTLCTPDKVSEIAERARPLLYTAGSAVRADPPSTAGGQSAATDQPLPPPDPGSVQFPTLTDASASAGRGKHRSGRRRSAGVIVAAIVGLCLLAVAVGSAGRWLWNDDDAPATGPVATPGPFPPTTASGSTVAESTTTSVSPTTSITTEPLANGVAAPLVEYTAVCSVPGAGWELVPTWPGDLAGLANYEVEMLVGETWVKLGNWGIAAESAGVTLYGQPANAAYTLRITAIMVDSSRSPNTSSLATSPPTPC